MFCLLTWFAANPCTVTVDSHVANAGSCTSGAQLASGLSCAITSCATDFTLNGASSTCLAGVFTAQTCVGQHFVSSLGLIRGLCSQAMHGHCGLECRQRWQLQFGCSN